MLNRYGLGIAGLIVGGVLAWGFATNWTFKKNQATPDCATKIKDLATKFGQTNLDSKTAKDFYNYLLG